MTLIFKNILMFLFFNWDIVTLQGFPASSVGKEYACSSGDPDSIPGLGRSPGEGKGYPLQYSGLENSMGFQLHGFTKSRTWLSDFQSFYNVVLLSAIQGSESVICVHIDTDQIMHLTYENTHFFKWRKNIYRDRTHFE